MNISDVKKAVFFAAVLLIVMVPATVVVRKSDQSGEKISTVSVSARALVAEARCRSYCRAERKANNKWSGAGGFLDQGGLATTTSRAGYLKGAVGAAAAAAAASAAVSATAAAVSGLAFGGMVMATIPCTANASTAFIIAPVGLASPGPYVVSNTGISLKAFWSVMPGNWVLGSAYPTGVCMIYVGPYIFTFSASQVSIMPGMGTSLGP